MNWEKCADDPLVLKAWTDALRETHPDAVSTADLAYRRDPDQLIFTARDRQGGKLYRLTMTPELFMELIAYRPGGYAFPDAQCDPLYELLLSQLEQGAPT